MRLASDQVQVIKLVARRVLGDDARVILFGSRTDDAQRGGDIDLLFETPHPVGNRATALGQIDAGLIRELGDRKIDVAAPGSRYAALVGEPTRTLLDTLAFAERAQVLPDAQAFIAARRLGNALVHEDTHDAQDFLDSLLAARSACELFFGTIEQVDAQLTRLGIARD